MRDYFIQGSYLIASVLFILGLRSLTRPDRARRMATALAEDPSAMFMSDYGPDSEPNPDVAQTYTAMAYGYQQRWRDMIAYPLWGTIVGVAVLAALLGGAAQLLAARRRARAR